MLLRLQSQRPFAESVVECDDGAYRCCGVADRRRAFGANLFNLTSLRLFEEAAPAPKVA